MSAQQADVRAAGSSIGDLPAQPIYLEYKTVESAKVFES